MMQSTAVASGRPEYTIVIRAVRERPKDAPSMFGLAWRLFRILMSAFKTRSVTERLSKVVYEVVDSLGEENARDILSKHGIDLRPEGRS